MTRLVVCLALAAAACAGPSTPFDDSDGTYAAQHAVQHAARER